MARVLGETIIAHGSGVFSTRHCLVPDDIDEMAVYALVDAGWTVEKVDLGGVGDVAFGSVQSVAMLARCFIPEKFPLWDRCLYVDADTFFIRSAAPLRKMLAQFVAVGAATMALEYVRRDYFNTGVMLMDCEQWRRQGIGPTAMDWYGVFQHDGKEKHPGAPYDEMALNRAMLPHGVARLPEIFNTTPSAVEHDSAVIVHFRGPKPNSPSCRERFPDMLGGMFDHYEAQWKEVHERRTICS
jgi:lipopolysaccharide biosynthesis glycosyltransferase